MVKKKIKLNNKDINPEKTIIVIIDLQNDFCHPKSVYKTKRANNLRTARRIHKFVEKAKKHNLDIIYFQQIFDKSKLTEQQKKYYQKNKPPCKRGSFGAKYFEIKPPKDKLFTKYNFDIWQNKKFQNYLKKKRIETIIITGIEILCCVLFAILGADERGYNIIIPKDLVSSVDGWKKESKNVLDFVGKLYGPVVFSKNILNVWGRK